MRSERERTEGAQPPSRARAPRRLWRRFDLILAVVLVVAVAGLVVISRSGGGNGAKGKWKLMAESPLSGRFFPASVWTGRELLVWGGGSCSGDFCNSAIARSLADGAAYDPETNAWRSIAAAPLTPRLRPMAVWTGRQMLVWGGNNGTDGLADGAAYDPQTDAWHTMAAAPISGRFLSAAVWTGQEMVVWGGGIGGQNPDTVFADGAAYNPATDTWRMLAPSPLSARTASGSAWTNKELVVWGGFAGEDTLGDGAAYDPATNGWRTISPSPLAPRAVPGVWSGHEVLMWGGGASRQSFDDGAAYDPRTDTWRKLPDSPLQPRRAYAIAWTGTDLLVWGGGPDNSLVFYGSGAMYDPRANRWADVAGWNARFAPVTAWTGKQLLVWGGIYAPAKIEVLNDGARFSP